MRHFATLLLTLLVCACLLMGCSAQPASGPDTSAAATPEATVTATPQSTVSAVPTEPVKTADIPEGKSDLLLVSTNPFKDVELIENKTNPDGTYVETLLMDSLITLRYERLNVALAGANGPEEAVKALQNEELRNLKVTEDATIRENVSYPCLLYTSRCV